MMYKSIEQLNEDSNLVKKLVDVYVSSLSAYLTLGQVASTVCNPDDSDKERFTYVEQVNQVQSHLLVVQGELDTIKEKHKGATQ